MKLDLHSQRLWFLVNVKVASAAHILLLFNPFRLMLINTRHPVVLCQNYQLTYKYRNFYYFVIFLYSQTHFGHILTTHSLASACNNYSFLHVGPLFPLSGYLLCWSAHHGHTEAVIDITFSIKRVIQGQ